MTDAAAIQARLQALRDSYAAQLPTRIAEIRTLCEKLRSMPTPGDLKTVHRLVHSLTGSGATFGYVELSDAARDMENYLKELQEQGIVPDVPCCDRIDTYLRAVESVSLTGRGVEQAGLPTDARLLDMEAENRLIYLIEDDSHQAQDLSLQIQNFGYTVRVFVEPEAMKSALQQEMPAAIIMDIMFPQGDTVGTLTIGELKSSCQVQPPVIFISSRDDLDARLAAVRACGDGYFTKPVDVTAMIDMLDRLTEHRIAEAYRILIVDDDKALADHYALTLRQAGMEVVTVNKPLDVMSPLLDFKPDLILMDVYMEECDGLELAAVLRQQPNHDSIPIVFLSTEADIDLRMRALHLGADDFLCKPILPDQLIASVGSRAQRARVLRGYMIHDGLTGLFNYSTTKEYLQREFIRTRRQGVPMAYGMLDLDYFKTINDTFGHAAGDRVLKSLARILQQRLRKSDIIGRVGGEEFAVVLSDTSAATAMRVMDEIRIGFSQIRHYCEAREFTVTFSCGIATLENGDDPAMLYKAADQALYQAKQAGRNRVVLAQGRGER